jgi:hypothetical protein
MKSGHYQPEWVPQPKLLRSQWSPTSLDISPSMDVDMDIDTYPLDHAAGETGAMDMDTSEDERPPSARTRSKKRQMEPEALSARWAYPYHLGSVERPDDATNACGLWKLGKTIGAPRASANPRCLQRPVCQTVPRSRRIRQKRPHAVQRRLLPLAHDWLPDHPRT